MKNGKKRLEIVAKIAICLAASVVVGRYALLAYQSYHRAITLEDSSARVGDTVRTSGELALAKVPNTLLLVTRSGCHFCTESMPFHRRPQTEAEMAGVQLAAATEEDLESNRKYLASHSVYPKQLVSAKDHGVRAAGTPTIFLIGADGNVRNVWIGRLSEEREREVVELLRKM